MMATDAEQSATEPVPWIAVAKLLRPQGRRGEMLAEPLTDLLEIFRQRHEFRYAVDPTETPGDLQVHIEHCWEPQGRNAGRIVLKLAEVDSINAAEALEGKTLLLRRSDLPKLESDTFFVRDLVGCMLWDGERCLGSVTDLQFAVMPDGRTRVADAADLLVVRPMDAADDTHDFLVPFVKAWLQSIDLNAKSMVMTLPPGLFE